MKTINCRDDSLVEDRGMWTTMKKKKRCIVVAQGFYEWLKKNGSKEKIPHFTKRKDGQLMCFAGLWDCVQFEGLSYCLIIWDLCRNLDILMVARLQRETLYLHNHHHRVNEAAQLSARSNACHSREWIR